MVAAVYLRISKEDEQLYSYDDQKMQSNSIMNQRLLIRKFIMKQVDLSNYDIMEYCDDGYSGTNFDRPGIKKLIQDAQTGKIQCIIVKDFSRFGRNYIEVGNYLEQIFPSTGLRFISINDGYDSYKNNENFMSKPFIDTAIKNLIHDYYSRDISQKVKASFQVKREKGQYLGGGVPYGYKRLGTEKGKLIVDEEAAAVVKRIYQMTMDGYGRTEIARSLNREKIPSPAQYQKVQRVSQSNTKSTRNQKYWNPDAGNHKHWTLNAGNQKCWKLNEINKKYWTLDAIIRILRNEVYIGNAIGGKYQVKEVGSRKNALISKKDWHISLHTHEPIISKEFFEAVQKTFNHKKNMQKNSKKMKPESRIPRVNHKNQTDIISQDYMICKGKIICGYCNYKMDLIKTGNPYYKCISGRFLTETTCSKDHAVIREIEKLIRDIINSLEILFITNMKQYRKYPKYEEADTGILKKLESELLYLKLQKAKIYENYYSHKLSLSEYQLRTVYYSDQIKRLELSVKQSDYIIDNQLNLQGDIKYNSIPGNENSQELKMKFYGSILAAVYFFDSCRIKIVFNLCDEFRTVI